MCLCCVLSAWLDGWPAALKRYAINFTKNIRLKKKKQDTTLGIFKVLSQDLKTPSLCGVDDELRKRYF